VTALPRHALSAAGLWLLLTATACAQMTRAAEPLDRFPQSSVEIVSGDARHRFDVWVADTPARRAQGLMFVRSLDADRGMLFLYDEPQYASFWMQNTYLSLDLLFVGVDGRIINIIESARPLSTDPLLSQGPAAMVLEVAGGTSQRLGIRPGDRFVRAVPRSPLIR
jgi:uncharacterized membrane protein (UPF0127 family)